MNILSMPAMRARHIIDDIEDIIHYEKEIDKKEAEKLISAILEYLSLSEIRKNKILLDELSGALIQIRIYVRKLDLYEQKTMSKYQLIMDLCESRIFRSKASINKYTDTMFYAVLLSTIALALDPKTHTWASKYASKTAAFGNFNFFRPSGTDLYVLTYIALREQAKINDAMARNLLRVYKGLGKGSVDSNFTEQTLLRLERSLGIKDARLRQARRVLTHWSNTSDADQKQVITNLQRVVRLEAKIAEVLPYLDVILKGEAGHFGKMTPGKAALAIAGAGLAGLALGLNYDPNKRGWRVFKNSAVFDGEKMLKEDRPTQLFHIVQNLNHHPDIERVVRVNYIADGISALIRDTEGNAYEIEIRPAPFAKGHQEARGVNESYGDWEDTHDTEGTRVCPKCKGSGMSYDDGCLTCYGKGRVDDDGFPIEDIDETSNEENPECEDCYDTGWRTEQSWEDTVNAPCDCENALEFRNKFVQEDVWQWRIIGRLDEHTKDTSILGGKKKANAAAVIALTPDDLDLTDKHKNNKHDCPDTEAEVRAYLKSVRDRYDVEIVDDFLKYTGQDKDAGFTS